MFRRVKNCIQKAKAKAREGYENVLLVRDAVVQRELGLEELMALRAASMKWLAQQQHRNNTDRTGGDA